MISFKRLLLLVERQLHQGNSIRSNKKNCGDSVLNNYYFQLNPNLRFHCLPQSPSITRTKVTRRKYSDKIIEIYRSCQLGRHQQRCTCYVSKLSPLSMTNSRKSKFSFSSSSTTANSFLPKHDNFDEFDDGDEDYNDSEDEYSMEDSDEHYEDYQQPLGPMDYMLPSSSSTLQSSISSQPLLTVSILGPPNAGKSTLFNRLLCKESNRSYRLSTDKNNRGRGSRGTKRRRKKGRTADTLQKTMKTTGIPNRMFTASSSSSLGGSAIVSSVPGTTRDRRECIGRIGGTYFRLFDTAGIDRNMMPAHKSSSSYSSVHDQMMKQTMEAARVSDLVLLLFDGRAGSGASQGGGGMTSDLLETARWLRKVMNEDLNKKSDNNRNSSKGKPKKRVMLCANKLEGKLMLQLDGSSEDQAYWNDDDDIFGGTRIIEEVSNRLGFGPATPLSALHGDGIADIAVVIEKMQEERHEYQLQKVQEQQFLMESRLSAERERKRSGTLTTTAEERFGYSKAMTLPTESNTTDKEGDAKPLQLAILGRPNVGKSTLVNQLIESDRVLTGATPGLTRDAITIPFIWKQPIPAESDGTSAKKQRKELTNTTSTCTTTKFRERLMQIVDTAGIRKPKLRQNLKGRSNSILEPDGSYNGKDGTATRPVSTVMFGGTNNNDDVNSTNNKGRDSTMLAEIEELAVADAMRALKTADVAVLVLDAQAGSLHKHELAICNAVLQEGRALVIVANKMDLLIRNAKERGTNETKNTNRHVLTRNRSRMTEDESRDCDDGDDDDDDDNDNEIYTKDDYARQVREELESRFPVLRKTPIVPMSSLTGEGVSDLFPVVFHARDRWARTISTGQLNRWLRDAVLSRHAPPPSRNKPVRIKYIIQTKGRPPTFLLFCSGGGSGTTSGGGGTAPELPVSYIRYLIRHFQDTFDMYGMDIRFAIKSSTAKKGNPFLTEGGNSVKKSNSSGIGGREARQKRLIESLKSTGRPPEKKKRSRKKRM